MDKFYKNDDFKLEFIDKEVLKDVRNVFNPFNRSSIIIRIRNLTGKDTENIFHDDILEYHKYIKIFSIKIKCEQEIIKGFTASNGHIYRTNRDDQINMVGQKDYLGNSNDENVLWKTEDSGYITHTRGEWLQVYDEAFKHKKDKLEKYNNLKLQILGADTHEKIDSIKW